MAQKLPEAELRKLAADFDPPAAPATDPKTHHTPPLTGEKRVRVTASLTQEQYAFLKKLAKKRGLPMSRILGEAVDALRERER
ncbi:MAG: ribbon-helix-helix domain-containing protein [Schwartzia sp.]|nr:ribbon-helix-helix domain-containing protein [Schwartzia sp. (in: firmicutes)]